MPSLLFLWGCGASAAPAPAAPVAEPPAPKVEASPAEPVQHSLGALPEACDKLDEEQNCLPPAAFVERLCNAGYPSVALAMFRKGTPWTRGYLTRNVEAWNVTGATSTWGKLIQQEEVLVLRYRGAAPGGMIVSGVTGGYDVLRWDGTCATVSGDELTKKTPPEVKSARVKWKVPKDPIQDALRADAKIEKMDDERRKECRSTSSDGAAARCEKVDQRLSAAVASYLRKGGLIPSPERLP